MPVCCQIWQDSAWAAPRRQRLTAVLYACDNHAGANSTTGNLLLSHFTDFTVLRDDPDHYVHKAVKAAVGTYNVEESQHYMHIVTSLLEAGAPVEKNSIVAVSNAQSDPGSMQPDRLQEAAPLLAVLNDAYQDQVRA